MSATGTFAKSASSVYAEYGYETNFGGGVTNPPIQFGKEVKVSALEFKNNQMPLGQLYSPEIVNVNSPITPKSLVASK